MKCGGLAFMALRTVTLPSGSLNASAAERRDRNSSSAILGGGEPLRVRDGRSVDTSMGMTPLEGLVMSTRSGDLDPGLLLHLMKRKGMTADNLQETLYRKSGLLGLSGNSDDIRDLEPAAKAGDDRAAIALEIQAYRVRKYIGAYAAALGGVDAIGLSGALARTRPRCGHVCSRIWISLVSASIRVVIATPGQMKQHSSAPTTPRCRHGSFRWMRRGRSPVRSAACSGEGAKHDGHTIGSRRFS